MEADHSRNRTELDDFLAVLTSGRQFEAQHPGVIHWQEMIPRRIQQMAFDRDIRTSLRQLIGMSQSRGIGI